MKHFLPGLLLLISGFSYSQKYALIDKKMSIPLSYINTVTLEHSYKNLFAVEKDKLTQFLNEVEKICSLLSNKAKPKLKPIDFFVGSTRFVGLPISLSAEKRLDVVLTTDCETTKVYMHLSDANMSNSKNVFLLKPG